MHCTLKDVFHDFEGVHKKAKLNQLNKYLAILLYYLVPQVHICLRGFDILEDKVLGGSQQIFILGLTVDDASFSLIKRRQTSNVAMVL